jgi:hypothetical protein
MTEPVRIKYFGLSLTRQRYLVIQGILLGLVLMLTVWALLMPIPSLEAQTNLWITLLALLLKNIIWIMPLMLLVDGIEVYLVLRRFAWEEAAQRAKATAPPPAPAATSSSTPPT